MLPQNADQNPNKIEAIFARQTSNTTARPPVAIQTIRSSNTDVLRLDKHVSNLNLVMYVIGSLALVGAVLQLIFKDHEDVFAWAVIAFGVVSLATTIWVQRLTSQIEAKRETTLAEFKARATAEIADARDMLGKERAARRQIEAGLASRRITEEQFSILAQALQDSPLSVCIFPYADAEAIQFAEQLKRALSSIGLRVSSEAPSSLMGGAPPQGVLVENGHNQLVAAFRRAGIIAVATEMYFPRAIRGADLKYDVGLMVGQKPAPF